VKTDRALYDYVGAAPAPFLRIIVVHELAHLKEREHDKAFHAQYTLELDVRLRLTALEL
jgi:UTP pyrophosphatase